MLYGVAADVILLVHLTFILFVVGGALLVFRWRWLVLLHVPAVIWGTLIESMGWICPLTPLENWLRLTSGGSGYTGSFIEQYLLPIIYPAALTRNLQLGLGILVVVINLVSYSILLMLNRKNRSR